MTPRKFKIGICSFPYGGNGGVQSEHPDVRNYYLTIIPELKARVDIEEVCTFDKADTPITMTRNWAVMQARKAGLDFLLMVDSDMSPDCELAEPGAKPFLKSSLDFAIQHYERGPTVIFAPYCGPPPCENVYVFRWRNYETDDPQETHVKLDAFSREEAAERVGIEAVAAGPTGLILCDMRAFTLTEPKVEGDKPWFYYEWTDRYATQKGSTEDVTFLRDLSVTGSEVLGYNPVFCNWFAWAGHWKPKMVRKPRILTGDAFSAKVARAIREHLPADTKQIVLDLPHVQGIQASIKAMAPVVQETLRRPLTPTEVDRANHLQDTVAENLRRVQDAACGSRDYGSCHETNGLCAGNASDRS